MQSKTDIKKPNVIIIGSISTEAQIEAVEWAGFFLDRNPFVKEYYSPLSMFNLPYVYGTDLWRTATFNNDLEQLSWADVVVAIVDTLAPDSNTSWLLGVAYSLNKPVITIVTGDGPLGSRIADSTHYHLEDAQQLADYNFLKLPKRAYTGKVI